MGSVTIKGKIIDSFLFSDAYEKELLLIKFILEAPYINEWIILENAYSFQGEYKGLNAADLINDDERFLPYKDRITFITKEMEPEVLNKEIVQDEKAFRVEFWQRDLAHDYFINKYDEDDWIIISDVDEALDFTDDDRCKELFGRMADDALGMLHVSTKRYWFDFDNEYKILYGIPMCTKKYLLSTRKKLHNVRFDYHADLKMTWNCIIGFEYSSCFKADNIIHKLETGSHMGFSIENLQEALFCNHRIISEERKITLKPTDKFFLDTISLTAANSPRYVRENLASLKTHNIHPGYKENRYQAYPHFYSGFYHFNEMINEKRMFMKKKFRNLLIKLRLKKLIYG